LEEKTLNEISLLAVKVCDVMTKQVIAVDSDETVRKAVDLMNDREIGCILVLTRSKVDGIVTERDILKRVIGDRKDADTV
jgi:CBS domain-containing protein